MALLKLIAFLCAVQFGVILGADPCPFNRNCQCVQSPDSQTSFISATCTTYELPAFAPMADNAKYTVDDFQILQSSVSAIPANHFVAFSSIASLTLEQNIRDVQIPANWDQNAFAGGVIISELSVINLNGLIPPPAAVIALANNLKSYKISSGTVPVDLGDYTFDSFSALTTLSFQNVQIKSITPFAFSKRDDTELPNLVHIYLNAAGLQFVPPALRGVTKIQTISLEDNSITSVDKGFFQTFESLNLLSLRGNNIARSITDGNLNDLSDTLRFLHLDRTGITDVPTNVFIGLSPTRVSLTGNSIASLKNASFFQIPLVSVLELGNNPITDFELETFRPLSASSWTVSLKKITARSIDLALFSGLATSKPFESVSVDFDDNTQLIDLMASYVDRFPANAHITVRNTGVRNIDPKVNDLLMQIPTLVLDISENYFLFCNNLGWVNQYRDTRVLIQNSRCADKASQLLSDYLSNLVDPTAPTGSTEPTTGPTGTGPTGGSEATNPSTGPTTTAPPTGSTSTATSISAAAFLITLLSFFAVMRA